MDKTQQGIVTLLKSAVRQQSYPLPDGFSLAELYPLIRSHHMQTLIYDGAVRCGISRKEETMQQLFRDYCRHLLRSEGQMAALSRLCAAFDEAHIDYMPLKGCKMKAFYPKAELRSMGDADVLIRLEQYETIRPIVEAQGFAPVVESDHELVWRSNDLLLELHKRLIPSYNKDFYGYFGDGWRLAQLESGCRYGMKPEDELIYLFTHFSKHFRDGGIGCRYVVDLWVYLRVHPQLDVAYLEAELKKLQLWEFYGNIRGLIDFWFEDGPGSEKLDVITDFIFASGSWGNADSHLLSQMVRASKESRLGFSGKLMYLQEHLFPKGEKIRQKYPILDKAPWALPLVWAYRPFYKLVKERKDFSRKREALQTITKEGVDAKRQMLQYVGLDFHH